MKGVLIILLIAFVIVAIVYIGKGQKEKSSPQEMVQQLDKARLLDQEGKIRNLTHAIDSYYTDHGEYPEILQLLVPNYVRLPSDLEDNWGTQFKLELNEDMNLVLISAGKDKVFGNEDDIKRRI